MSKNCSEKKNSKDRLTKDLSEKNKKKLRTKNDLKTKKCYPQTKAYQNLKITSPYILINPQKTLAAQDTDESPSPAERVKID
ncbi:MAG: hypothetical protein JSR39_06940 [Verrucomicrobia bacterium]|nr:hypothetical protein [Verrucomicrobiota bacterium]